MPVGTDAFIVAFLNTLLSQYGALVVTLMGAVFYFQRELGKERTAHAATADKLLETAKQSIAANSAAAEAIKSMGASLDRILDRLTGGGRHGR